MPLEVFRAEKLLEDLQGHESKLVLDVQLIK